MQYTRPSKLCDLGEGCTEEQWGTVQSQHKLEEAKAKLKSL